MAHIVPESIVVVGAGLAGLRVCEQLRAQGYEGTLTLVGTAGSDASGIGTHVDAGATVRHRPRPPACHKSAAVFAIILARPNGAPVVSRRAFI